MNELILIDKIEKRLKERREPVIFPLASNHRKELRQLKETNIGNLRERLRIIKILKKDEYIKKYKEHIESTLKGYEKKCHFLNDDWLKRVTKIKEIIQERRDLEKSNKMLNIQIKTDYGWLNDLNGTDETNTRREFIFNKADAIKRISNDEFENKFNESFKAVEEKIDDVMTKYEEAINFGDLEIVKELYYIMKKADSFFNKIERLKV